MIKYMCKVCGQKFQEAYEKETHHMAFGHNLFTTIEEDE